MSSRGDGDPAPTTFAMLPFLHLEVSQHFVLISSED